MAKCDGCYDRFPCEWEEKELFEVEGYDGHFCNECQMQLEQNEVEYIDYTDY